MRILGPLLLTTYVLCLPLAAYAAWPTDTTSPLPVATSTDAEVLTSVSSDGYYGLLMAWQTDWIVCAQYLHPTGREKWTPGGIEVAAYGMSTQTQAVISNDGQCGAYIAWTDDRNSVSWPPTAIRLQHVTAGGDWAFAGDLLVSPYGDECHSPLVLGGSGGAYVAYRNESRGLTALDRTVPLLQLSRVALDGTVDWTIDVDFLHPDCATALFPDGAGGAILVWTVPPYVDPAEVLPPPAATLAHRVGASGSGVWGSDPVLLYNRAGETATVAHDGQGGLWVAGRWPYLDSGAHADADGGEYVVVNHLLGPTGDWAWGSWVKALEWDSHEKSRPETGPVQYTDYNTDQNSPRLVPDGEGGVYVLAKDDRKSVPVSPPGTEDYRAPDESLVVQRIDSAGVLMWNEDASGYWTAPPDTDYSWMEGLPIRVGEFQKNQHRTHCEPWTEYVPFEQLINSMTSVWADDADGGFDIRAVDVSPGGNPNDWGAGPVLTVCNAAGDQPAAGHELFTVAHERFGTYVVWTQDDGGDLNVYATHFNHWEIYSAGRAQPVGPGPDIFPPPPVSGLTAAEGADRIILSWTNPADGPKPLEDVAGVMIRRATTAPPLLPAEGDWVYEGPLETYEDVDVTPGVTYHYSVFVFDTELVALNYSEPEHVAMTLAACGNVGSLLAEEADREVRLSWDNAPDADFAGVLVLRREGTAPTGSPTNGATYAAGETIGDGAVVYVGTGTDGTPGSPSGWTDTGLTNGTAYHYSVFACDQALNYSSGEQASATPADFTPPSGITGLGATPGDGEVRLTWTNPFDADHTGVLVLRRVDATPTGTPTDGTTYVVTDTIGDGTVAYVGAGMDGSPGAVSEWTDTSVVNGTTYCYVAFAYDEVPNYSAPASDGATPLDAVGPAGVSGLSATAGDGEITLSWTNPTTADFAGALVVRREGAAPATAPVDGTVYSASDPLGDCTVAYVGVGSDGTPSSPSTWTDTGLANGTRYHYAVFAFDEVPNYSGAEVTNATPAQPGDDDGGGGCTPGGTGAGPLILCVLLATIYLACRPHAMGGTGASNMVPWRHLGNQFCEEVSMSCPRPSRAVLRASLPTALLAVLALGGCRQKPDRAPTPTTQVNVLASSAEWSRFESAWEAYIERNRRKFEPEDAREALSQSLPGLQTLCQRGLISNGEAELVSWVVRARLSVIEGDSYFRPVQTDRIEDVDLGGAQLLESIMAGTPSKPESLPTERERQPKPPRASEIDPYVREQLHDKLLALQNDLPYIRALGVGAARTAWTEANVILPVREFLAETERYLGPAGDDEIGQMRGNAEQALSAF